MRRGATVSHFLMTFTLCSHPTETILLTAISILHKQMLFFPEEVRPEVRDCGGPIQLASLLTPGERLSDPVWLTVTADALRMTAYEDQETKVSTLSVLISFLISEQSLFGIASFPYVET